MHRAKDAWDRVRYCRFFVFPDYFQYSVLESTVPGERRKHHDLDRMWSIAAINKLYRVKYRSIAAIFCRVGLHKSAIVAVGLYFTQYILLPFASIDHVFVVVQGMEHIGYCRVSG